MFGRKHLRTFLAAQERRGTTHRHIEHLASALSTFYRWWARSGLPKRRIDVSLLDAYRLWLTETPSQLGAPQALRTIASKLAALRGFLRFLAEERLVSGDLSRLVLLPRAPRTMRRVLAEAELVRLCQACRDRSPEGRRDRAYLELLIATAMRPSEAAALEPSDLKLRDRRVRIRRGKGGKLRWLPLTRAAVLALRRYLKVRRRVVRSGYRSMGHRQGRARQLDRLFLSSQGAFSKPFACDLVEQAARRAHLDGRITPYTIRHSVATALVRAGLELRHLQVLLGHRKSHTSELYFHLAPQDLKAAHRKAHPRERNPRDPRGSRR
ncbi:MAG: tyrosine-type recombinase/integrase [Candidatus Eremiobacteraeota bacterium]|nr:tyrosine-type recombinase/integrase [Candidatus Eremiobacteraeota bacterium]